MSANDQAKGADKSLASLEQVPTWYYDCRVKKFGIPLARYIVEADEAGFERGFTIPRMQQMFAEARKHLPDSDIASIAPGYFADKFMPTAFNRSHPSYIEVYFKVGAAKTAKAAFMDWLASQVQVLPATA